VWRGVWRGGEQWERKGRVWEVKVWSGEECLVVVCCGVVGSCVGVM
jgi:hypothetical protein